MSWAKFVTMFCDSCENLQSTDANTVPDAREVVENHHGWRYVDGEDLCANCSRRRGLHE